MLSKAIALKNAFLRVDARTIYFYAFLVGCITGVVAILFRFLILQLSHLFFYHWGNFPLEETSLSWLALKDFSGIRMIVILLIPALGGLLVGLITKYWGKEAAGTGVDYLLDSFHNRAGEMRSRTPFIKFVASVSTLSTGGSTGKEGPMALIGAGLGSLLGRWVKMGARAKRTLLLAGSAGGLGAIFRAPLGGAITAVEVLYKEDFEADALLPCIISSVTAYTLFSSVVGFGHVLKLKTSLFSSPIQLIFYAGLGLFCSGVGYIFINLFRYLQKLFDRLPGAEFLKPALGGLGLGILVLLFPQVAGEGVNVIQKVIEGAYPPFWLSAALFLLTLAIFKMFATGLTVQSGGSGGVLIPSLFIGAMLGGFFGIICHRFFPNLIPDVTPFVVVGMAAFFSSITNASLGALVMVSEMTGGYELLPPLMVVGVVSLIASHKWSIYQNQVTNKFSSQAHLWDMDPMNLKPISIGKAFPQGYQHRAILKEEMSLKELKIIAQENSTTDYIVENENHDLIGLISLKDLPESTFSANEPQQKIKDKLSRALYYVSETDNLFKALQFLLDSDFDKVPVVKILPQEKPKLLGYLQHQDILRYYYRMGLPRNTKS